MLAASTDTVAAADDTIAKLTVIFMSLLVKNVQIVIITFLSSVKCQPASFSLHSRFVVA